MNLKFIENTIKYDGRQLSPHWIYKNFNLMSDSIVAFVGECEVKLNEMVDIEDVIKNEPIYSPKMLSFIVEHFEIPLFEAVLRQRMLMVIIKEELENLGFIIKRNGDDLFFDGRKLSVSIATKSVTSALIHTGLNISTKNTPIKTSGLEDDLNLTNIKDFALNVMSKYNEEMNDIKNAISKVRGLI